MLEQEKVMIVDDNPHVVRSLAFVSNKEGYSIPIMTGGEEALEKMRESKPSIMFMDVMLPVEERYEVSQEVKSNLGLRDIYIVMLTDECEEADSEEVLSPSGNLFITKKMKIVFSKRREEPCLSNGT